MIRNRSIGLSLLVLAFGLVGSGCEPAPRKSSAKLKAIPALATPVFDENAELMVRSTDKDGGDLLIAQPRSQIVAIGDWRGNLRVGICYKYDTKTRRLSLASTDDWHNAKGSISFRRNTPIRTTPGLTVDALDYTLKIKNNRIETQGPNALKRSPAPKSDMVAVVSADGRKPGKDMFVGRSGFKGQHYHQLFERSTGKLIEGSTVKIPFVSRNKSIGLMWSADEKFVIYSSSYYRRIAIVHIQPRNQP